jgi:hypothetical protein
MTQPAVTILKSTSQLTPAGILGYAKGIAVAIGGALTIINEQLVPEDWPYKHYLTTAIAICTLIATIAIPNAVKEQQIVDPPLPPPAPQPEEDDEPGKHEAPEPVVGVVEPPVPPVVDDQR